MDIDISIVFRRTFLSYVVLNVERKKDLGFFFAGGLTMVCSDTIMMLIQCFRNY